MHTTNKAIFSSKAGWAILFSAVLGVTGCGGSSSSGGGNPDNGGDNGGGNGGGTVNEQPANIQSEDDARLGADAAVESAQQAIINENAPGPTFPGGVLLTEETHQDWLISHSIELSELDLLPSGATTDIPGGCGGNARLNYNEDFSNYQIIYNNYCTADSQSGNLIIDGTIDWFGYNNIGTDERWGYNFDYSITEGGQTEYFRGNYTCGGGGVAACSYANNYEGRNGRNYRSENVSVSESNGSYGVSARVYDEDLGYIDYQASNLVLCEGGYGFSSGTITVSDSASNEVLTVTFSGCDSFTMTYQGAGYTINY